MKLEKLFKKVESFFCMDRSQRYESDEKREKLINSLSKKIDSMKEKIKKLDDEEKKDNMKKELDVLKGLKNRLDKENEDKFKN
ncbi:MAG: hypothetical protein U9P72_12365 [Campylobacterota bacterium]|nr:hypothetical protein [Campylobacterota bacterium]